MRTRRRLILFFLSLAVVATVALALAGFLYWPRRVVLAMPENKDFRQEGEPAAQLVQMFGGAAGLETIRHPDRVEGFRIFDDPHDRETSFPVTAGPILVAKSDADLISAALLSPDSYGWKYLKGCDPDYGVCLSFFRGSDRVDVALCFFCGVLLVGRNGTITGGEDFDPICPLLMQTVKNLFPDDGEIQALQGCCRPPSPAT